MTKCTCKCSHCRDMGNVPGRKPIPQWVWEKLRALPPIDWT